VHSLHNKKCIFANKFNQFNIYSFHKNTTNTYTPYIKRKKLPTTNNQQTTTRKVSTVYRSSESQRAVSLLKLCRERQDKVFTRFSACNDFNDIFAADILYHRLCWISYFNDHTKPSPLKDQQQPLFEDAFSRLITEIDHKLEVKCYELSNISSILKEICKTLNLDIHIDNSLTRKTDNVTPR